MKILDKSKIDKHILPHLSKRKRGPKPTIPLNEIVMIILNRAKTGSQWRYTSIMDFTNGVKVKWQAIYKQHRKWCKDGSWKRVWTELLKNNHAALDMSCVQLDGSQTSVKRGGEAVGFQGRKASKTTNSLFLADNSGQMLAMSTPQAGSHHDLFEIDKSMKEILDQLHAAQINPEGLFLNADAGFDAQELRKICSKENMEANIKVNPRNTKEAFENEDLYFDDELYKRRIVIEHANAWIDSFKGLLVRFETSICSWVSMHYLAFACLFIKKLNTQ